LHVKNYKIFDFFAFVGNNP